MKQNVILFNGPSSSGKSTLSIALQKALEYETCEVNVTCPLQELIRREQQRKNRCLGSAEASFQYLFPQEPYDLTVDTFQTSIEECTLQIIKILQNGPNAIYKVINKIKLED